MHSDNESESGRAFHFGASERSSEMSARQVWGSPGLAGDPCLTLRENTERQITVEMGTNAVVGSDTARIVDAAFALLDRPATDAQHRVPPLWDGPTAGRIVDVLTLDPKPDS